MSVPEMTIPTSEIAIIGMSGQFPGAKNIEEFWSNIQDGVESITAFSRQELADLGIDSRLLDAPNYVKASAVLEDIELFDANFFNLTPKQAAMADPQQRLFIESAWEALEQSGYNPHTYSGAIGVYAGSSLSTYLLHNLLRGQIMQPSMESIQTLLSNDKDYLATQVSYKLNLKGPSLSIQTACSTSLVAVHLASQSLLNGECDIALAGGVTVRVPHKSGYFHQEGGVFSPDGHCRAFDAAAQGTVFGNGVGIVVLKRLSDALADNDHIWAVIRGSAVNNDGSSKVGYTAPSVEGQASVIAEAIELASIEPETITYVEAHGTGTALGDPIEVAALKKVFRNFTERKQFCALGSVKANIGHLESAAGIAGLIKTVLALHHQTLPPSAYFKVENPQINFADSPFYINTSPLDWTSNGAPRRAGVSSFGIGGTNAHLVLEEAPSVKASPQSLERPLHTLTLSAKSGSSLKTLAQKFADHLGSHPQQSLVDIAFTANSGRAKFNHRLAAIADSSETMRQHLEAFASDQMSDGVISHQRQNSSRPKVAFLFTGQGAQYVNMGRQLYETQPLFREILQDCDEILRSHLPQSLLSILYGESDSSLINETIYTQPALFTVEYGLARLWQSWGITPTVVLGHSLGEYVAACIAGVFNLEDGLKLVAERARLMQSLEQHQGKMAAVFADAASVNAAIAGYGNEVSIAAFNGPTHTVISGQCDAVQTVLSRLEGVDAREIKVSHAFHSHLMEPILGEFEQVAAKVQFSAPKIPLISNVTGQVMKPGFIPDASYWCNHLRSSVRFLETIQTLAGLDISCCLECGPKPILIGMGRQCVPDSHTLQWLPSLKPSQDDWSVVISSLSHLFVQGYDVDWFGFDQGYLSNRVPLPTYPFERQYYWIDSTLKQGRPFAPDLDIPLSETFVSAEQTPLIAASDHRQLTREELLAIPAEERHSVLAQYLCSRLAQVLGIAPEQIDLHKSLHSFGLESLMALELKNRVEVSLGATIPLKLLLQDISIFQLADRLLKQTDTLLDIQLPTLISDPENRFVPFPLNEMQQAYWLGRNNVFAGGGVSIHLYLELDCEQLDLEQLGSSWQHLVQRHEMLRAIILPDGQQQVLSEVPPYEIQVDDLQHLTAEEISSALQETRDRLSHQVLSADQYPLFEIRTTKISEQQTRLHISIDGLISDAWSYRILFRDWAKLYSQPQAALPPLEISYRDYILSTIALQKTSLFERSLQYWHQRISMLPPAPALPLSKNPASLKSPQFVHREGRLEPSDWQRLKERAARAGLTSAGLQVAIYAEVLTTWSETPHFTINIPRFNRLPLHPQVNDLVGEFASFTLLEVDNSKRASFEVRAKQIQEQLWQDLEYHYVSGVRILRELAQAQGVDMGVATMPVVFTSLPLDAQTEQQSVLADMEEFGPITYALTQTPQVWLDNQVFEDGGALIFFWDAVEELFPAGMIGEMFDTYSHLLKQLANSEEAWQAETQRLTPKEQLEQREAINSTEATIPLETLYGLFTSQATHNSDKAAIIAQGRTLTYGELYHYSNQLGRYLRAEGAAPNQLVAILMDKGWEQIVAVLGILASGAAYLPIDPSLPAERLQYVLENAQAQFVLTQSHFSDRFAHLSQVTTICVDRINWSTKEQAALDNVNTLDDLAYVIYTSGSTGLPKGVMISHRSVVNMVTYTNQRFHVGVDDCILALTTLHHDLSVYDVFGLLIAGGTVVIPNADSLKEPAHWISLMQKQHVTLWNSVPAMMEMLVETASRQPEIALSSLRLAILGGDWIPLELPNRIKSLTENVQICSIGGPTETTVWNINYPIDAVEPNWKSIPYGMPISNSKYYILNGQLEDCPTWVTGEMYCAGAGLAQGYWQDDEKTTARFITRPSDGERLYRTGDLGRYLPDGNIEFMGRVDFQVKIRGHRIEVGEIEHALMKHSAVRTAIVTVVNHQGKNRLAAYVVPHGTVDLLGEQLSTFLSQWLPPHMVPTEFIVLESLPLTANGKVDRKSLQCLQSSASSSEDTLSLPRNQIEEIVAGVWAEVLSLDQVGRQQSFFKLGGDSLLATRTIARLQDMFQVELSLRQFFQSPTVSGLAKLLVQQAKDPTVLEKTAQLILTVAQLSEQEAETMLEQKVLA
ncbi:MAG: amino acid adenylation domain-containing protein [Cyanobacteria bacterium P01_H01_bin.21]